MEAGSQCDSWSENMGEESGLVTRGQPRQKGVVLSPGTEPSVVSPPSGIRVIVVEDVDLHNPCSRGNRMEAGE